MTSSALEQIRQAEAYKEEGNRHFGEGSWKKALGSYHKVFCFVNGLQAPPEGCVAASSVSGGSSSSSAPATPNQIPPDRVSDVKTLKQSTKLNMAACYLKLGEHQKCVDACTAALEIGGCPKGFFRRGQALAELRNFAGARADLERARELAPDDPKIPAELRRIRANFEKGSEQEKEQYAKMFAKAEAQDPPPAAAGAAAEASAAAAPGGDEAPTRQAPAAASAAPAGGGQAAAGDAEGGAGPVGGGGHVVAPMNKEAVDEVRKLDFAVRELTYAWQQSEEDVKIYVPFDQSDELSGGVDESMVQVEFGEWNVLLLIRTAAEGRVPLGLRLGDFHRRVAPELCRCTVRGSRITLKLVKQTKEHWWNLLQHAPLSAD